MTSSFELYQQRGPTPGTAYPLAGKNQTIGRDRLSDIVINDPEVSRQHALLIAGKGHHYRLQDLGSTNGTFVDGMRLGGDPVLLRPSSVISMGSGVVLIFRERVLDLPPEADAGYAAAAAAAGIEEMSTDSEESAAAPDDQMVEVMVPRRETNDPVLVTGQDRYPRQDRSAQAIDLPHSEEIESEMTNPLSPRLILSLILLLLCCLLSVIAFLIYLGGDWYLRQLGIVP